MANVFDRFDRPGPTQARADANVFDQFDGQPAAQPYAGYRLPASGMELSQQDIDIIESGAGLGADSPVNILRAMTGGITREPSPAQAVVDDLGLPNRELLPHEYQGFSAADPDMMERGLGGFLQDLAAHGQSGVQSALVGAMELGNADIHARNIINNHGNLLLDVLSRYGIDPGWRAPMLPGRELIREAQDFERGKGEEFAEGVSDKAQAKRERASSVDGFGENLLYYLSNPDELAMASAETIPQLAGPLLAGRFGRALGATGIAPAVAGGAAVAGGLNAAEVADANAERVASGEITEEEAALNASLGFGGSATINSILPMVMGQNAQVIERVLSGARRQAGQSVARGAAKGGAAEFAQGVVTEGADQAIQNVSTGRPVEENLGQAMALGGLIEGAIGAGAGAIESAGNRSEQKRPVQDVREGSQRVEVGSDGADPGSQVRDQSDGRAGERSTEGPDIPDFPGLSPAGREVESRARDQVRSDPEAALAAYAELPDTDGGRIINTDSAREIFPDYSSGPEARSANAAAVHEPASWVANEAFRRRMGQPVAEGKEARVFFTGGGTGAGKSTGPKRIAEIGAAESASDTVFDGNLSSESSAVEKIERALASGREAYILYTFRDPVQAFVHGALPRAERADYGRTVPFGPHANTHVGAAQTYFALKQRYADNPNVQIRAIWNDFEPGVRSEVREATDAEISAIAALDRGTLEQELSNALEAENQAGRVSPRVYQGTRGNIAPTQPERRPSEPVDRQSAEGRAEEVAEAREAVRAVREVVGNGRVEILERADQVPERFRRSIDSGVEGFYDEKTGTAYVIWEAIQPERGQTRAQRAAWVAAHEWVGHHGVRGVTGAGLKTVLNRAKNNSAVAAVMRAMAEQRPETGIRLVEEAVVELAAAVRTGDYAEIENRYGVTFTPDQRSNLRKLFDRIIAELRRAFRLEGDAFSDADLFQLIEDAGRYADASSRAVSGRGDGRVIASRSASRLLRNLTPAEQKKVTDKVAEKIEAHLTKLPSKREMAAVAHAGRAKRGWYRQSAETISAVFGADAPLFAGLLAALSPQISVEGNLKNALNVWNGWVQAGRPTDTDAIKSVLRDTLRRTYGNTLQAWENNTVRALQGQGILSGPKVDSFMRNLLGDVEEVTNDAWMANYSLVNQTIFKGALNVKGTDPGKGSGYLAMNVRIRETARELTRLTGETWSPAEVQETIWSWAKTITEMADSATEIRSAEELVLDQAVTDDLIASTPDFSTLFTQPEFRTILEEAGYVEQLQQVDSQRDAAEQSRQEPGSRRQAAPFAEQDQLRLERQAARRIDRLREQRAEAAAADEVEEVPFSRRAPGKNDPLPGAPKVRGATGPIPELVDVAERYAAENGIELRRQSEYVKADPERGARIAAAYEAMEHAPNDPRVREAYENLIKQTTAQYRALEAAGYRFYFDTTGSNPWDAMRELRSKKTMGVFPTNEGFGSGDTEIDVSDNPLMADTGIEWPDGSPDGELRPVLANDLFRAVHDAFGHGLEGAGFRADGEENAWQAHVRLFTGSAVDAITTETRGQNSWLNFGPHGETNRTAKVEDTVFADQKTGLLPKWVSIEGRVDDEAPVASRRRTGWHAKRQQKDAVSATGYHYSVAEGLDELDPRRAGSGSAGGERRRFGVGVFGRQGGTAARVAFYVSDDGVAPEPESMVTGRNLYRAELSNLYDLESDPRGYAEDAGRNQDMLEELISDGGFDGFLAPPQAGIDVPTAVVFDIGKKKIPVEPVESEVIASRGRARPYDSKTFGKVIIPAAKKAYDSLGYRAKNALDSFQMGVFSRGNMIEKDAEIAGEIESAFSGVRELIRENFGDTVTLYRVQNKEHPEDSDRSLFSWSFSNETGRSGAGEFFPRQYPVRSDEEIDRIVTQLREKGHTRVGNERYVRSNKWPEAPDDYFMIYDKRGNVVTDHVGIESLRDILKRESEWTREHNRDRSERKSMYRAQVPVEQMFWVYQDALSAEAIVRRDPAAEGDEIIASRGRNPQVDTPEFKRWFGDSKVVDENGDPLVVYHGASSVFDVFDSSRSGENTGAPNTSAGFFFTNDEWQADSYVGVRGRRVDAFLRIENPATLRGSEYDGDASGALNDAISAHAGKPQSQITEEDASDYVEYLKRRGFDGIEVEIPDDPEYPKFNWVVFDPSQIKSATGNSGAFDPENPSIVASRRDPDNSPTGTRNRTTDAEREAEGRDPIIRDMVRSNEQTVEMARAAMSENPRLASEIAARPAEAPISSVEEAVLLIEKVRLRNKRDEASKIIADPEAKAWEKAAAKRIWDNIEQQINAIDEANVARGREWGRMGQFRQRMMASDYSLEAMESRLRKAKGEPLTPDETASLRELSERMKRAEAEAEEARRKLSEYEASAVVRQAMEQAIKDAVSQAARVQRGKSKIDVMKERADAARRRLTGGDVPASRSTAVPSGVDPQRFVDLYHVGAYHVASGRTNLTSWVAAMKADLGQSFTSLEPYWADLYAASKAEADVVERAYAKEADPKAKVLDRIDPGELTQRDVRDLVMIRIRNGETDPDAVLRGVTKDIESVIPGIELGDVRDLFVAYGKKISPTAAQDRRAIGTMRAILRLRDEIDRVEAGGKRKAGPARQQAAEEVRQLRARLSDALKRAEASDPSMQEALRAARIDTLNKRIADLEDQIATGRRPAKREKEIVDAKVAELQARRDELVRERRSIDHPPMDPETRYQIGRARSIENQIKAIEDRLKRGDYSRAVKVPRALNEANEKAAFKLERLRREFRTRQFNEELKNRSRVARYLDNTVSGINLARAIMTSFDLSGYLRQGGFITLGHPIRGLKGVPSMLRAFVSERAAHAVESDIQSRENAPLYRKYGLQITSNDTSMAKMEEAYMTRWLERIDYVDGQPVRNIARGAVNLALAPVRGSGRAYVSFLNKLRADTFDAMAATLTSSGEMTEVEGKALANYINAATGRGQIPGFSDAAAVGLNTVFFAPRLVASRFQILSGQPMYGGSNRTRAAIAGDYARFLSGVAVVYALGYLAWIGTGHDEDEDDRRPFIELDPRSSSFGRMRFGDWFIDPLAGLAQVSSITARTIGGETKTSAGDIKPMRDNFRGTNALYAIGQQLDRAGFEALAGAFPEAPSYEKITPMDQTVTGAIGSFLRSKMAPVPGAVLNTVSGENMIGQPVTPGESIKELVTPMTFGNVADAMKDKGVAGGVALVMAEILGMSVQYRDRSSLKAPDYNNLSYSDRKEYSDYLRVVGNYNQDVRELRSVANMMPVDTPAQDVVDVVEMKASALGLDGVSVAQYSKRTRARGPDGERRSGIIRTESGGVQLKFSDESVVSVLRKTEKDINEINEMIDDVLRRPMTNAELNEIYRKFVSNGDAKGNRAVVARSIADERKRKIKYAMSVVKGSKSE